MRTRTVQVFWQAQEGRMTGKQSAQFWSYVAIYGMCVYVFLRRDLPWHAQSFWGLLILVATGTTTYVVLRRYDPAQTGRGSAQWVLGILLIVTLYSLMNLK
jgi:hypothetical protein